VQSLSEGEMHTGTRLHEDLETLDVWHNRGLNPELRNIPSKDDLMNLLRDLKEEARLSAQWPVLHIEVHGNRDGIVLASGDFISWQELKIPLIELNIATRNNLLVVLSACYGAYLTKTIIPTDRAPCWGLVGPHEEMSAGALLSSFQEFYSELFATGNGDQALKRLNDAVRSENLSYLFSQCESFFKMVYKAYFRDYFSPKALKLRAGELYKRAKEMGGTPKLSPGEIKRKLLQEKEPSFEKHCEQFFMYDLYRENRKRFRVTYQDILNLVASKPLK